jgi:hypothetical protein
MPIQRPQLRNYNVYSSIDPLMPGIINDINSNNNITYDYIDMLESKIVILENNHIILTNKISELERKLDEKSVITDSFLKNILNKIDILKNMIKKDLPEGEFISINLTEVESIESEIIQNKKVLQKQLIKLNEIYSRINK